MVFKCSHCGQCCENVTTQINVTIGDVVRLSDYLKMTIKDLVPGFISINPFGTPGSNNYELDLGMNIACKFRKRKRCIVYEARPLNCRLFPMWIIANAPLLKLPEIITIPNRCDTRKITEEDRQKCRLYVRSMGAVFSRESKQTDQMLEFIGERHIILGQIPGTEGLALRQIEEKRIKWLLQHKKAYPELAAKIEECGKGFATLAQIKQIEEDTKPF